MRRMHSRLSTSDPPLFIPISTQDMTPLAHRTPLSCYLGSTSPAVLLKTRNKGMGDSKSERGGGDIVEQYPI